MSITPLELVLILELAKALEIPQRDRREGGKIVKIEIRLSHERMIRS